MVIAFTDGGNIYLHPGASTAGIWTKVDGASSNWNDAGQGGCAGLLSVSYQQALSCHLGHGASVKDVYVVSDAPYPAGVVDYIDDISYGGSTITGEGSVLPFTTPIVTRFGRKARIGLASGHGTFTTVCQVAPGNHCHFNLTIRAAVKSGTVTKRVRIGTITGTTSAGVSAKLHVALNARGRSLLLAHQGKLPVRVSGPVTDDEGNSAGNPYVTNMTLIAG
ncbi:MAG TPA: hypothetical protein VG388_12480 [Solirubrobacteraceae bacterium]|nr:hypothetical protein [Solirubrobacteraceae bacterium]